MKSDSQSLISILLLSLCILMSSSVRAEQVGEIQYARGAVTLQQADGSDARLIGKGDSLHRGEVVKTGPKSFVILRLEDGTRMTLRPDTAFAVEDYKAERSNKASALLRLFRGGMRTITGSTSKTSSKSFRIKTPTTTIAVRGAEFDARLCTQDCAAETSKLDMRLEEEALRTVAKVVFIRGDARANDFLDKTRSLTKLSPVYEGDTIITAEDSYAILVFRDKSRISLQENTLFRIDELRFNSAVTETGISALFSLLRGGLRTVTGLIGKTNPDKYRMRTAVATMGIHGTGYDLLCTGQCASDLASAQTPMPEGDGLYAHVWEGEVIFGEKVVKAGQAAYMKNKLSAVAVLPNVPAFFIKNPMPKPNTINIDESNLFTARTGESIPEGLYVHVSNGEVTIKSDSTKKSVKISKGQAAFVSLGGQLAQQLPVIPSFQQHDPYPRPDKLTPNDLELKGGLLGDIEKKDMTCEIK